MGMGGMGGGPAAPGPPPGPGPEMPGAPGMSSTPQVAGPGDMVRGILMMGLEMDKSFNTLSQEAPQGAQEFAQARAMLQAGLAKYLQAMGVENPGGPERVPASVSPTTTGSQFPGPITGSGNTGRF